MRDKSGGLYAYFFAHQSSTFYGVVHAGWKGLTKGILKGTSSFFTGHKLKLNEIDIYIGPSIQKCCFEVSKDIIDKFPSWSIRPKRSGNSWLIFKNCL